MLRCFVLCLVVSVTRASITDHVVDFITRHVKNDTCRQHTLHVLQAFNNLEMWAVQMVDASAKLQSGILDGNLKNLGHYDQCVESRDYLVTAQYCLVNVHITPLAGAEQNTRVLLNHATQGRLDREIFANTSGIPILDILPALSTAQLGVCVPETCGTQDVAESMRGALQLLLNPAHLRVDAHLSPDSCYIKQPSQPWTSGQLATGYILITLVALTAAGTYFDTNEECSESHKKVLKCFSLPRNWKNLTTTDSNTSSFFSCLDGIRVFNTFWIVYGHKTANYLREPIINQVKFLQVLSQYWQQPMLNTLMSVDSFFFISGLLKSRQMLREVHNESFSFGSSALQRFLRLTPAYGFMILFYATILPHLGNGPSWNKFVEQPSEACNSNWFWNLLYVHNYINNDNMCMLQSWYLAVDMQLHLLAPLIVYPIWRWAQHAAAILAVALTAATVVPFAIIMALRVPAIFMISAPDESLISYMSSVYFPTHTRASSFIVGIALGYIFFMTRNSKFIISKMLVCVGWVLSLLLLYKVMFAAYELMQFDQPYDALQSALYGSLHRPAWALALAWVVFACHTGYGGWINSFLSARIFQPLSRLCYCVYLTHFVVLLVESGRMRTPRYIDEYDLMHCLAGDFLVSIIFAAVVHLLVEAPISELTSLYYKKDKKCQQLTNNHAVEENGKSSLIITPKSKKG